MVGAYAIQISHFTKVEIMLGKEHPDTLISMNNLALALGSQGSYEKAEQIQRRAKEYADKHGSGQ